MSDDDFASQVRAFFGAGTQLQELYITPSLLNQRNWDDLAEAANWSRRNADVLVDTHWIGGDPAKGEVYGWASWSPRKGVLVLRNPGGQPAAFTVNLQSLFELPTGSAAAFQLQSPWKKDADLPAVAVSALQTQVFNLRRYGPPGGGPLNRHRFVENFLTPVNRQSTSRGIASHRLDRI